MADYAHYSLKISKKLLSDLRDYCDLNNLKLSGYIEELILKGFSDDKFGDAPFLKNKKAPSNFLSSDELAAVVNKNSTSKEVDDTSAYANKVIKAVDVEKTEEVPVVGPSAKIKKRQLKIK